MSEVFALDALKPRDPADETDLPPFAAMAI